MRVVLLTRTQRFFNKICDEQETSSTTSRTQASVRPVYTVVDTRAVTEMSSTINAAATSGFASSAHYDAYRPSYPPASVDALLSALHLDGQKAARVLEIGAGTGKFTSILAAQPEAFEVLSVEPHADMRRVLDAKGFERVRIVDGTAEDLGAVEDGWADACIVAQVSVNWCLGSWEGPKIGVR